VVNVGEDEIEDAVVAMVAHDQVLAEGSGAVGVAALRSGRVRVQGDVAAIVTGANMDARVLARLLAGRA
jgi:threonine dehydratase